MKPEELEALADRIDHDKLWSRPGMERDDWTPEQRDRCDAGVNLRRYAHDRGLIVEELKKGAEFIRGYKLTRHGMGTDARGCGDRAWHGAINRFSDQQRKAGKDWPRMMYAAKMIADEVPRMILLFEQERNGLATHFKLCAHDPAPARPLPDNHLRCHLGQECRKCEFLGAIEASTELTHEAKDEAKAWTCATHVLLEASPDDHLEQILRDKSDDAFDTHLVRSFAQEHDDGGLDDHGLHA
jgi:hypothetical protein